MMTAAIEKKKKEFHSCSLSGPILHCLTILDHLHFYMCNLKAVKYRIIPLPSLKVIVFLRFCSHPWVM